MPLDDAGEAAAFGGAGDIHQIALGKDLAAHLGTGFPLANVIDLQLAQELELAESAHVTLGRAVHALAFAEADLDGVVAVALGGLDLDDDARGRLDNSYRDGLPALFVELRHADFPP